LTIVNYMCITRRGVMRCCIMSIHIWRRSIVTSRRCRLQTDKTNMSIMIYLLSLSLSLHRLCVNDKRSLGLLPLFLVKLIWHR
jgi:hypothetical protein